MKIRLIQIHGKLIRDTKYYILLEKAEGADSIPIHYDDGRIICDVFNRYEFTDVFEAKENYNKCIQYYMNPGSEEVIEETELL